MKFNGSTFAVLLVAAFVLTLLMTRPIRAKQYDPQPGSIFTVTRGDDRNNANCVVGDCSLREAINAANASTDDDTIKFTLGLTAITLNNNEIVINNAGKLVINGNGANVLTIDGGPGANRIFYTNNVTVTISALTLTGGNGGGTSSDGLGGAIFANEGSLILDRVHVKGNSSTVEAGGIFFHRGVHKIVNSSVYANSTYASCGGFYNSGTLTAVNSTISGNNTAELDMTLGGGFCNDGNATLRNVTVTNNSSDIGGGIAQIGGTLNFGNTIVAGNTRTPAAPNCYCYAPEIYFNPQSSITSAGYNLVGDSSGDSAETGGIFTYQSTDIRDTDPLLGALQNNGGSTFTHALTAQSPVIDRGRNALAVDPGYGNTLVFDQRGTGFARISGGLGRARVDIGAFEVQQPSPNIGTLPSD